ncbi:NAD(P)H-dependent oxidoreductase [Paenibacillus lautus]
MRAVIVFDHPYGGKASENVAHRRSFSAALLSSVTKGLAQAGHQINLIDLHEDGFDPVMSAADLASWRQQQSMDPHVADYQQRLMAADYIFFIFPIWWESMPAMTKGFLDKVFAKGILYDEPKPGRPFAHHLPCLKGVYLLTVMSTPNWAYRLFFGNPITKILFRGTFRKMGFHKLRWLNYTGMERRPLEARIRFLNQTQLRFSRL